MTRKQASFIGNILIITGLVVMSIGIGCAILNQLPQLEMPQLFSHSAILGIFVGAILWLVGARIGGHEQIDDRYWWVRHYDKRCRHDPRRNS
ncbi:stress-induced protein YchH [Enterobacteriaceae bacterium ESL0689]|nr:stress-induced protein YchH [Enterobacteriaceae bacterium ESL0689]